MCIYRGVNSLYSQLRDRLPGVNPSDYIEFFCLRSWGIMNDKVVSDQIYVHDKVVMFVRNTRDFTSLIYL